MKTTFSLLAAILCALAPTGALAQTGPGDRSSDRPVTTTTTNTGVARDLDDDDDKDYGWIGLLGLLGLAGLMKRRHTDHVVGPTTTRADIRH